MSAVELTSGTHPSLDAAALAAARALRFGPATLDGRPVAVRVPFRYRFEAPRIEPPAPVPRARLTGEVRSRGNRRPVPGAILRVEGSAPVEADAQGHFTLELPPGRVWVRVSRAGVPRPGPRRAAALRRRGRGPLRARAARAQPLRDDRPRREGDPHRGLAGQPARAGAPRGAGDDGRPVPGGDPAPRGGDADLRARLPDRPRLAAGGDRVLHRRGPGAGAVPPLPRAVGRPPRLHRGDRLLPGRAAAGVRAEHRRGDRRPGVAAAGGRAPRHRLARLPQREPVPREAVPEHRHLGRRRRAGELHAAG